jgi:aspartyl-tRNA(Asn)/glutamyl-tRNA(Gln) amidotransferase subunit A
MMTAELHSLTLAAAADLIRRRVLSPVEYVRALLARIDAVDSQLGAIITRLDERALAEARDAESSIAHGRYKGPLHGIPFGLKDVFDTRGVRTTGGSKLQMHNVPVADATAVRRLQDAGAIVVAKLATPEFASGGPSLDLPWLPARNPWDTAHFTGGSSSGPGAAVAAGFVPLALGTDTGGSIRIPAAFCGLAGLKPTYDLVSRQGVMPNSHTFDHVGPMAWSVEDCAIALGAIAEVRVADYRTPLNGDIRGLRIGVVRHFWEEEGVTNPAMAKAMDEAIDVLAHLGAQIDVARMRPRRPYSDVMMVIAKTETAAIYVDDFRKHLELFGSDFIARTIPGLLFSGEDYVRAQRERSRMVAEMTALYARFDVLLTATNAPAPVLQTVMGAGAAMRWHDPSIYTPFNVTGGPALALCNGYTQQGLPLSMQLAGRPFDETTVLRVGHAYELATDWRNRRPELVRGSLAPRLNAVVPAAVQPIDPQTRMAVEVALARARLHLDERQLERIHEVAVPALAAARRIAGDHAYGEEPASTFHFS